MKTLQEVEQAEAGRRGAMKAMLIAFALACMWLWLAEYWVAMGYLHPYLSVPTGILVYIMSYLIIRRR